MSLQARQESVIDMPYVKVLFGSQFLAAAFQVTFQHETMMERPPLELFQDVAATSTGVDGSFLSCREQSTITPQANLRLPRYRFGASDVPTLCGSCVRRRRKTM